MKKKELKRRLGLPEEAFIFYVKMGKIWMISENEYAYDKSLEDEILEKSTVFKYSFGDDFITDIKEFKNMVKYTSKVKVYTKKEIEEYMKNKGWK